MATAQTNNPGVPATGNQSSLMASLGTAQQLFNIYADLQSKSPIGYTAAAASAAQLAGKQNLLGSYSGAAGKIGGDVSSALGIYSGIKQGGVVGDLTAASSAAKLASQIGSQTGLLSSGASNALGTVAGVVGVGLDVYNEIKTWQSGATGSDALAGGETGAAVGTMVLPGIGTAVGAVIGAAVGALSSLFGGGKADPETTTLNKVIGLYGPAYKEDPAGAQAALGQMSAAQSFTLLAGTFDAKNNSPGHSQPIEQAFGRMQEGAFLTQMAGQINQAVTSGKIPSNASPTQVWASVVQPWVNSKTNGQGILGAPDGEGGVITGAIQNLIGQYMSGKLTASTPIGSQGQAATDLPAFAGAQATKTVPAVNHQQIQPFTSAVLNYPGSASSSSGSMLPVLIAMPAIAGAAGVTTGASSMADPNTSAGSSTAGPTNVQLTDPSAGGSSSSGSSVLGTIGSDISSFLTSPAGNLAEFGTLAGLGISQANSQKGTNDTLAASLGTIGQPYTAAGAAELTQLEGGAPVSGPLGASIAQQTSAAKNLGDVANEYSTGQMTPAQQQQVSDYVKQQRAMVDTQLASSGNPDSSAKDAAYQQIDDNAAKLGQDLISGNTTMATQALSAVQSTYSNLLNQSLSEANFGFGTQEAAVQTQIASDTQLAASLNSLFAGLAQGFGTALGGGSKSASTGGSVGQQAGQAVGSAVKAATSGGVAQSASGGGGGGGGGDGLTSGSTNYALNAPNTDFMTTDFSTQDLFGGTTPAFDVQAQTGVTPSFDTGFMNGTANPFGDLNFNDLSSGASQTAADFSLDPWS